MCVVWRIWHILNIQWCQLGQNLVVSFFLATRYIPDKQGFLHWLQSQLLLFLITIIIYQHRHLCFIWLLSWILWNCKLVWSHLAGWLALAFPWYINCIGKKCHNSEIVEVRKIFLLSVSHEAIVIFPMETYEQEVWSAFSTNSGGMFCWVITLLM